MWKFHPVLKTTIWGGGRILPFKGMSPALDGVGESWEVSGVPGHETVVEEGPDRGLRLSQLIEKYGPSLLGERNYSRFGNNFPLLVKFIDARENLSVQVHPDDVMARRLGMSNGKSEMWYVLESLPGARIANGFTREVSPGEFNERVAGGSLEEVLNFMPVSEGEVYFIPGGRVHSIGAGAMVMEIQQTSDATFRIYDYGRLDADGNPRELHLDAARDAIDYGCTDCGPENYQPRENLPVSVVRTPYFSTNVLHASNAVMRDYSESDTFVVVIGIDGEAEVSCGGEKETLSRGHCLLVPASAQGLTISPKGKATLIETYIA